MSFGSFNYFAMMLMLSKVRAGLVKSNPVCSECEPLE